MIALSFHTFMRLFVGADLLLWAVLLWYLKTKTDAWEDWVETASVPIAWFVLIVLSGVIAVGVVILATLLIMGLVDIWHGLIWLL